MAIKAVPVLTVEKALQHSESKHLPFVGKGDQTGVDQHMEIGEAIATYVPVIIKAPAHRLRNHDPYRTGRGVKIRPHTGQENVVILPNPCKVAVKVHFDRHSSAFGQLGVGNKWMRC